MTKSTVYTYSAFAKTYVYILVAAIITSYLFYIDEGNFNFNWIKNFGNWIVFAIYVSLFTAYQWLIKSILAKFYKGENQTVLVLFTFLVSIIGLIFFVFKS